jgi:hypothetical protein
MPLVIFTKSDDGVATSGVPEQAAKIAAKMTAVKTLNRFFIILP